VGHHAFEQALVLRRVVGVEVGLEPDLVGDLGPFHRVGVLGPAARAVGVGVIDQRALDAELGRERLLRVARAAPLHPAAVVLDRFVEQLFLAEVVLVLDVFEAKQLLEVSLEGH
jgi:hypothetical protein